jgi:class 3 adenylate cyclase
MTLLSRLFLLVAVALLPAIAIQTNNEFDMRRWRQAEVQDQALGLAKLAAAEQQQIVQGIRQVLIALSELPAIKAKDTQRCSAYLSTIKQRFPAFLTFLVASIDGRSFCDTNIDHEAVTVAGRAYFASALKTGAFTVGEFSIGRSTGRKVIQFALPFFGDDGRPGGVIVAALSLDWLADHIARSGIPPGAALATTDRGGTYLARYPNNDRFIGRKMPDGKSLSVCHPGMADALGLDGIERIVGHSALSGDSGELLVSVGLNKAQAFAAIQRRTQRGILLIVLSTFTVLILTWLGARRFIDRPLGQLVDAANQLRLGDYVRRVNIREKQSEIARVGDAFNTMADALRDRERTLRETERQRANLARFFSPQRVEQLVAIDTPLSVARYQPAAVLFVDMIGFTAYCSRTPPDAVITMLRDLLALLSASVFSYNGTIDKFLGDGLMAVFGTPTPSPVEATNAARCALGIQHAIERWNERCCRSGDVAIRVAVGIHYGDVVQGDIGSEKQLELTVLGDTVNIASRVEAYCRSLDAAVLVTGALVDRLHAEGSADLAETFADQGHHILRGRAAPIHLYGVKRVANP